MKNSRASLDKRNRLKKDWFNKLSKSEFPRTIQKRCKDCGEIKDCAWQHSFTQTGEPEYRVRCVECQKRYLSSLRIKRRARERLLHGKRIIKTKEQCIRALGGKCKECGESDFRVLTFHHIKPEQKTAAISSLVSNGYAFTNVKLQAELKKCELLCFNCHMKKHGGKYV